MKCPVTRVKISFARRKKFGQRIKKLGQRLPKFGQRLYADFFSDNTYNTVAYYVFYFGYFTGMYPIERPVRQKVGNLGEVVVLQYRFNPYQHFVHGVAVLGLFSYLLFEILQIVRFVPTEGFTLNVVYIMYYFAQVIICFLTVYCNFKHERILPNIWNCIEANTKRCQYYGAQDAAKWKYSPISLLVMLSVTFGCVTIAIGLAILYAVRPNVPGHLFYFLPEPWKTYKAAYVIMLLWQVFLILVSNTGIVYMITIVVGFIIGTGTITSEVAQTPEIGITNRIRVFRAVEMVNQMANEYGRNVFFPIMSFVTVSTGVTFTYVALTRFGDDQLGVLIYSMVIIADVILMTVVTVMYTQAGKCSDSSAELIESTRMAMKKGENLTRSDLPYLRKQLAALRPFHFNIASFAKLNFETVKLLQETIIDYLMLLFSY